MAAPTWDNEYLDFTGSDWTKTGTPSSADDHWNLAQTYALDGTDDYGDKATGTTEHWTSGTTMGCGFWFKTTDSAGSLIYEKVSGSGVQAFLTGGTILFQVLSSASDYIRWTTTGTYNDGNWHHCILSVTDSTTIRVYIDSALASGTAASGGTWGGHNTDSVALRFGADNTGADLLDGIITRIKTTTSGISAAEASDEYDAEIAAISGWGSILSAPDVEITDMSTLTEAGTPTYTDDGKGGNAVVISGSGANRVSGGSLAGAITDQYLTYVFMFNIPPNSTFGYVINMDDGTTNRNTTIQLPTDGKMRGQLFGGAPITSETNTTTVAVDTTTTQMCILTIDLGTEGNKTDHTFSTYIGALGSTLTRVDSVQSVNLEHWDGLAETIYGSTVGGAFYVPNNSWIGQVRSFHNKGIESLGAEIIRREYASGNFGAVAVASTAKNNPLAPNTTMLTDGTMYPNTSMLKDNSLMKI